MCCGIISNTEIHKTLSPHKIIVHTTYNHKYSKIFKLRIQKSFHQHESSTNHQHESSTSNSSLHLIQSIFSKSNRSTPYKRFLASNQPSPPMTSSTPPTRHILPKALPSHLATRTSFCHMTGTCRVRIDKSEAIASPMARSVLVS